MDDPGSGIRLADLRCLVAVADEGTFTDAAIAVGTSQPAVSRAVARLESALGARLLHRTSRQVALTPVGSIVLDRARQLLRDADDMVHEVRSGHRRLRVGHAWGAAGEHTAALQRLWAREHPAVDLHLVRTNSTSGGLAEGTCDVALVRAHLADPRFEQVVVGLEPRYCAVAADDPWARRRSLRLVELAARVVAVDPRTGTTTTDLWPAGRQPATEVVHDVDDWLDAIAAGRCVGVTAASTVAQYPRPGVVFRRLRDAAPVAVRLLWPRADLHPATHDVLALLTRLYRGDR